MRSGAERSFNSIKVRLKPAGGALLGGLFRFQFHKGTIKTKRKKRLIFASIPRFNSIKVRLKPVKSKVYNPRRLYRFAGAKIQKIFQINVDAQKYIFCGLTTTCLFMEVSISQRALFEGGKKLKKSFFSISTTLYKKLSVDIRSFPRICLFILYPILLVKTMTLSSDSSMIAFIFICNSRSLASDNSPSKTEF